MTSVGRIPELGDDSTADAAITETASAFFPPLAERVDSLFADLDPGAIEEMEQFLGRLHDAIRSMMSELDDLVGAPHGENRRPPVRSRGRVTSTP